MLGKLPSNADMIEGYMDGGDTNSPTPSGNRSWSYRWGFANRLRDKGLLPPHKSTARAVRIADKIIARDNRRNET